MSFNPNNDYMFTYRGENYSITYDNTALSYIVSQRKLYPEWVIPLIVMAIVGCIFNHYVFGYYKLIGWVLNLPPIIMVEIWIVKQYNKFIVSKLLITFESYYIMTNLMIYVLCRLVNVSYNHNFYNHNTPIWIYIIDQIIWNVTLMMVVMNFVLLDSMINVSHSLIVRGLCCMVMLLISIGVDIISYHTEQLKICWLRCSDLEGIGLSCLLTILLFVVKFIIKRIRHPNDLVMIVESAHISMILIDV